MEKRPERLPIDKRGLIVTSETDIKLKEKAREKLNDQIKEFLSKGGEIDEIPSNVRAPDKIDQTYSINRGSFK